MSSSRITGWRFTADWWDYWDRWLGFPIGVPQTCGWSGDLLCETLSHNNRTGAEIQKGLEGFLILLKNKPYTLHLRWYCYKNYTPPPPCYKLIIEDWINPEYSWEELPVYSSPRDNLSCAAGKRKPPWTSCHTRSKRGLYLQTEILL